MENTDTIILPELSMFFSTLHSQSGNGRTALIPCLLAAQDLYGYIPVEVIDDISHNLEIPVGDIDEVLDFYTLFHRAPTNKTVLHVCNDPVCKMAGADSVFKSIRYKSEAAFPHGENDLEKAPCLGICAHTPSDCIQGSLLRFQVKNENRLQTGQTTIHTITNILGETRQITRNCGMNRSCSLMEYWSKDGYQALKMALSRPRDSIIDEIKASGLTGRGGDSFLTGIKWEKVATSSQKLRFVVCNASEADPTNFKDRVLLEEDPHSVLEGMIIAGYAMQATQGYICINGEYDLAIQMFSNAIIDARQAGLLGNNIMGMQFNFDIELRRCAGRYISGEETALLEFIEGKCAIPRGKPPFPTSKGLFGKPTIINNTETFCNIPQILKMGSREYRKIGTETSKGTILISVTGDLNNPGLVEIPFGMTFRQVIFDLCGGLSDGHTFQAALIGGVTGTFINEKQLDIQISLDSLKKSRLSIGGSSIVVLSDVRNIKDVLVQICQFLAGETCGKCTSCINGTKTQLDLVKKSKINKLSSEDDQLFKNNRLVLERLSVCQMGISVTNAVGSAFSNWPAIFF